MSEERFAEDECHTTDDGRTGGYPAAAMVRLLPAVTFGLRAAALAGLAVSAGAAAFGLAAPFDDVANVGFPTCCGENAIEV